MATVGRGVMRRAASLWPLINDIWGMLFYILPNMATIIAAFMELFSDILCQLLVSLFQ